MNTTPRMIYHRTWIIGAAIAAPVLPVLSQTSPNLVFIMADQYRGDAIGCIGKELVKTPLPGQTCFRRSLVYQCRQQLSCFVTGTSHVNDRDVSHSQ